MFLLLLLIFSDENLQAQWVQTNGPIGGSVSCVVVNQNNIFASTGDCIYFSSNNGASWSQRNNGLPSDCSVQCFLSQWNNLYLGTVSSGVYLSTNNGISWSQTGLENSNVYAFAVNDSNIFAGTNDGLYISTDHGANWAIRYNLWVFNSLTVIKNNIFFCDNGVVFHSSDNGTSWAQLNFLSPMHSVNTLCAIMNNIFAGTDTGVYLSTNNGAEWTHVGELKYGVSILASSGNNLYASYPGSWVSEDSTSFMSITSIYHSTNNGTDWNDITNNLVQPRFNQIYLSGDNIFVATGDGLFLSSNNETEWTQVGLPTITINSMVSNGNNLFASSNNMGIYLSNDNGTNWKKVYNGWNHGDILIAASENIVFACSSNRSYGLLISTDNGIEWNSTSWNNTKWITSLAVSGNNVYAGTYYSYPYVDGNIYRSTNNGIDWTSLGLKDNTIASIVVSGNNIIAGSQDAYSQLDPVFLSTNNGEGWAQINTGTDYIYSLVASGNDIFAGAGNGVFLSTDNGTSWSNIGQTVTNVHALVVSGDKIIAGTPEGAYLSTNMGTIWKLANSGLSKTDVQSLAISGTDVIAGINGAGAWKWSLSEISGVSKLVKDIPQEFTLSQNYPNPFNPNTVISYSLPSASNIKLVVYNTLGQTIKVLESGYKNAGNYSVNFNASTLPSGIYFYKLEAGQFSQIKKMMLIK